MIRSIVSAELVWATFLSMPTSMTTLNAFMKWLASDEANRTSINTGLRKYRELKTISINAVQQTSIRESDKRKGSFSHVNG